VPEDVGEQLLTALREALSNVASHSGASSVEVQVSAGAELSLTVRDNGSGFRENGRRSGLANLDQRAAKLGGSLRIASQSGGGTELGWRVPLAAGSEAAR
jgi:signal transduction histidine kinase